MPHTSTDCGSHDKFQIIEDDIRMLKKSILGDGNGTKGLNTRMALQEQSQVNVVDRLDSMNKGIARVGWMMLSATLMVIVDVIVRSLHR